MSGKIIVGAASFGDTERDTDVVIEEAMMLSSRFPAIAVGTKVTGRIRNNHFVNVDPAYALVRLTRRPKLKRFAPLGNRLVVLRLVWRFMGASKSAA